MIVGRKSEEKLLEKIYGSKKAEFAVIFGRRRVGKTYLIKEYFKKKPCKFFHATGLQKGSLAKQLKKFTESISNSFFDGTKLQTPKSWGDAFAMLHKEILKRKEKVIIFLDELPWMATRKSGLLEEIDYYWNHYWATMPNVILIVCGSSASWLIQKIIYNKGGLHNRVTSQIKLLPFNLSETRAYLKHNGIKLNNKNILSLYMALGGIPYYLNYVEPGLTPEQNIEKIFFEENSPLKDEFQKLFDSLFENSDAYVELVHLIAKNKMGVSRAEIQSGAKLSTGGGTLSKRLKNLCETGFIEEHIPLEKIKGEYYKLIDEFCLFYLHWVLSNKRKKFAKGYWEQQSQRPAYFAWSGYAFEAVCMKHINQIIGSLNIKASSFGSWRFSSKKSNENGAQIDLLIERADKAISLFEIKLTADPFVIDKPYAEKLRNKIAIFKKKTNTNKQIFLCIISAMGIKKTIYSEDMIDAVVVLEDLFRAV